MYENLTKVVLHRYARRALLPVVLNRIEAAVRETDVTGLDYAVRMKTRMLGNLVRCVSKNLDRGFVSQHAARTMLETLVRNYDRPSSKQARADFTRRFGLEPPGFCVLAPTHWCNLKCIGCYAASGAATQDTLPYGVCSRLMGEMQNVLVPLSP